MRNQKLLKWTTRRLVARGNYYRGRIINQFCFLEMNVSVIITESFTIDRELGNHMYHTLLERMTFKNKRSILQSIIYSQDEGKLKNTARSSRSSVP